MFRPSFGPGLMSGFPSEPAVMYWHRPAVVCVSKIVSRGQLVNHFHKSPGEQRWLALTVEITKDLLPSFRIVAYCHANGNEVMSDSVWVDVRDSCMGAVSLTTRHQKRKKTSTDHHAYLLTCLIFFSFFFNWVCVVCVRSEALRFVLLAESKRWNRDCLFTYAVLDSGDSPLYVTVFVNSSPFCLLQLRLEPTRMMLAYEPHRMFSLKVTGEPGARVELAALDKSVRALNKEHRLTQKKVIIFFFFSFSVSVR